MSTRPYYKTWSIQSEAPYLPVAGAEGTQFIMENGEKVHDLISTSFQAGFGHSQAVILNRIRSQMEVQATAFPKADNISVKNVSKELLAYLKLDEGKIFYTVSGAEGIENALKMARQIRKAEIVLARENSYHGASLGALSVTGDWRNKAHKTVNYWTIRIPEPTAENAIGHTRQLIEDVGSDNIAAFCLETISGANGVITGDPKWWTGIQELCDEFGILLILDEVTCGFRRTGSAFAFQKFPIHPHFVVLGKAISGGYIPFGAVWTHKKISGFYEKQMFACGLTNYAHPLGLAALEGVLDLLNAKGFIKTVEELEETFAKELKELEKLKSVKAIRVHGLLSAIDFHSTTLDWQKLFKAGIHVMASTNRIILAPPLAMSKEHLHEAMGILRSQIGGGK